MIGAVTASQASTAGVTVNSYNHANGVLSVTSPTVINTMFGQTINSTLTFQNAGGQQRETDRGRDLAGRRARRLSGDVLANQTVGGLTGSFTVGAAGTTATNVYSANWLEDQSVIGAWTASQASTAGVTVNSYNNANGVLTALNPTVNAIAGATVVSTLSFQNAGANNDNLAVTSVAGGLGSLSGSVTANQTLAVTGSFTAPAVSGSSATNVFSANWLEDQTCSGLRRARRPRPPA